MRQAETNFRITSTYILINIYFVFKGLEFFDKVIQDNEYSEKIKLQKSLYSLILIVKKNFDIYTFEISRAENRLLIVFKNKENFPLMLSTVCPFVLFRLFTTKM